MVSNVVGASQPIVHKALVIEARLIVELIGRAPIGERDRGEVLSGVISKVIEVIHALIEVVSSDEVEGVTLKDDPCPIGSPLGRVRREAEVAVTKADRELVTVTTEAIRDPDLGATCRV
jgi:hypothetical protein